MKIDRDNILGRVRHKEKKQQVMLYLPASLYAQFKQACKDVVLSQVIEELIKLFLKHRDDKTKK